MQIHHVGYVVRNIEKAVSEFELLGFKPVSEKILDPIRHVFICFLNKEGYTIELISPSDRESKFNNLVRKLNNAPYHICYETNQFEADITRFTEIGYAVIDEPCEAPAIENRRVAFLLSANIGIIELLES